MRINARVIQEKSLESYSAYYFQAIYIRSFHIIVSSIVDSFDGFAAAKVLWMYRKQVSPQKKALRKGYIAPLPTLFLDQHTMTFLSILAALPLMLICA